LAAVLGWTRLDPNLLLFRKPQATAQQLTVLPRPSTPSFHEAPVGVPPPHRRAAVAGFGRQADSKHVLETLGREQEGWTKRRAEAEESPRCRWSATWEAAWWRPPT
jgi:hypothetical protein